VFTCALFTGARSEANLRLYQRCGYVEVRRQALPTGPGSFTSRNRAPGVDPPSRTGHTAVVKTAISLPDEVFERAERLAGKLGLTRSRLYALALEQYLDQADDQPDPVTEALNRIHADSQAADDFGAAAARRLIEHGDWEW
jgi:predicted DNA-binding protein